MLGLTGRQRKVLIADNADVTEEIVHEQLLRGRELHGSTEPEGLVTGTPHVQVLLGTQTDGVLVTGSDFDKLDHRIDAGRRLFVRFESVSELSRCAFAP